MPDTTAVAAVLWDIDGTLVDSEPNHHHALLAVCQAHAVPIDDIGNDRLVGVHMEAIWHDLLQERFPESMGFDEWNHAINIEYVRNLSAVRVRPNAIQTIRKLHSLGIRQAAVSNSARLIVDANLEVLSNPIEFEFSLSIDDVTHGKPDPQPYLLACSRLAVDSRQVLAVEDSPSGLNSACAAGTLCLAYRTAEFPTLGDSAQWPIIRDLSDVLKFTGGNTVG